MILHLDFVISLLYLKECVLLYFTVFVAFQDAATSVAK